MRYICPPKLQSKFLIGFWTVPEVFAILAMLIAGFYVDFVFFAVTFAAAVCLARIDLEHSLIGKIWTRILYYRQTKTYRNM